MILLILYACLGYWAAGYVMFRNKIVIRKFGVFFFEKLFIGLFFGIVLIPIGILMKLTGH